MSAVYTQRYNRLKRTDGSLFRGRYKAILVDSDEYLIHLSKYIHLNPLDANMAESLKQYKWSSYPSYIKRTSESKWLMRDEVYAQLGSKSRRAVHYKRFVEELETNDEIKTFYAKNRQNPVLGSPEFITDIKKEYEASSREINHIGSKQLKPEILDIIEATSEVFNVSVEYLCESKKGRGSLNIERKSAMYLVQLIGDYRLVDIAKHFQLNHYGGVSNAIHAIKAEIKKNRKMLKKLNTIINRFNP